VSRRVLRYPHEKCGTLDILDFGQNAVSLTYAVMSWVDVQLKSYQSVITFWKINALQLLKLIGSLSINCELLKLPINSPDTQVWMLKSYSFQPLDIHAVAVNTDKFVQSPIAVSVRL